ncbi:MAG: hypothetical protein P8J32_01915, partial [bacterium]|nr:hypothetical protein [bacterium]
MAIFPSFWFEGNLSFGTVEDLDDLHVVFERYKGNLTPKGVLDRATCVSDEYLEKWKEIRPEATKRIESGLS